MSINKNIRHADKNLDQSIKLLLNIKDSHISFSKEAVAKRKVRGHMATVFTGFLSYDPPRCPHCGLTSVNRHSFKKTMIQLLPYQEVPTYLELYKQRFYCKDCHHTFTAETYYVQKHCSIAQSLKFAIAVDLKKKISMKEIAKRYYVSTKTVERVLDAFFVETRLKLNYLPKHLLIDEFKGTKDCPGAMCFIISDADTGKIFDILDDRRNFKLKAYFMRFTWKARKQVRHVVMDMNAAYDKVIKEVFPKAMISIDRFHIIQQLTRALNKQRIQAMKRLNKNNAQARKDYRKFKKYWRTILKKNAKLNYTSRKQFPLFQKKYLVESEVVDYLLSIDSDLRVCYEVYQDLLITFDAKDFKIFFELIETLPATLPTEFKKSVKYLTKHKKAVINSLQYPYSNGKLEGKNNLIKVIKRIAFGFRTFRHLRRRVMVQQSLFTII
ncbi:ISL3 family transposase [Enterococcus sp. CSURQ0835]|uniref:ISL3 family transposase n=1 Tax=Enterococcus sp. CSURQ0835 TaxID=2681394 RepID=UPI001356DE11|nr:ISL3 family transposase [Enterococcus sp. CSURQ0835]